MRSARDWSGRLLHDELNVVLLRRKLMFPTVQSSLRVSARRPFWQGLNCGLDLVLFHVSLNIFENNGNESISLKLSIFVRGFYSKPKS